MGSRIPLAYGRETGANLVTKAALEAARRRMALVEPHQSIDHQRLWADLLSSEALTFNLFGDLAADLGRADRLVRGWFPDAPGRVSDVRFLYSPGRLDPQWLNSLRQFDAAFVLDRGDGTHGIVAVDVTYHERLKPETPKPENLWRYRRSTSGPRPSLARRSTGSVAAATCVSLAGAAPALLDAPASGRRLDLGPVRDRASGRQRGHGGPMRPVRGPPSRPDGVQSRHAGGRARFRGPPDRIRSLAPGSLWGAAAYFAYSTERVSRMTVTLIWPG